MRMVLSMVFSGVTTLCRNKARVRLHNAAVGPRKLKWQRALGIVPDVVNRALRKLLEEGRIQVECRQIHILDPDVLRNIAQVIEP